MKPREWFTALNAVEPIMPIDLVVSAPTPMNGVVILLRKFTSKFSFVIKQRRVFKFLLFTVSIVYLTVCLFTTQRNALRGDHLSFKEKGDLKLFFHDLFADNELGYTLFGDKPMSFCIPSARAPYFSQKDFRFGFIVKVHYLFLED
jgi:hypothetical protein